MSRGPHHTVGLVLPGGGARGAYQAGALKAIADMMPSGGNPFPVIMGASVGAINAISLASRAMDFQAAVANVAELWSSLTTDKVYRTDFSTIMKTGGRWLASMTPAAAFGLLRPRALLDCAPLGDLLRQHVDLAGIDASIAAGALRAVGVTASSYDRSRAITFFQGTDELKDWTRVRRDGVATRLDFEHVMASAALPLIFEARLIDGEHFGDGSLRLTSPLSPAIHCGADRILVIGVRDAKPQCHAVTSVYPTLGSLSGYLLDMVFMDNLDADIERARRVDRTLALLGKEQREETDLRDIDVLMIQPSRDVRDIAREHAHEMPWTIRMLLKRFGVWGRDWRLPSYLLFEPGYCSSLTRLGYDDAMARREEIAEFLGWTAVPRSPVPQPKMSPAL